MDDQEIVRRINELADEEHLEQTHAGRVSPKRSCTPASDRGVLDQCWDLLRQRRARRSTGQDPNDAQVRPEGVVEGYQQ